MSIFNQAHRKIIWITFNFSEFVSARKRSAYSVNSFLKYSLLILTHISAIRFFKNMGFVKEYTKQYNFHYWLNREENNDQIF